MSITFGFSGIAYGFYGGYAYITYIYCTCNAQNFGSCDGFEIPLWYVTHQKKTHKEKHLMRLPSFHNDDGFGILSPFLLRTGLKMFNR